MPTAKDVGLWAVDFEVDDGHASVIQTVSVEVRPTEDGAPVFRMPLSAGIALDLEARDCVRVPVLVEDADTVDIQIEQVTEPTLLRQAGHPDPTLTLNDSAGAVWRWCPQKDKVHSLERWVFTLRAKDKEHAPVARHFLIVLKPAHLHEHVNLGGWLLEEIKPKSSCALVFNNEQKIPRGGLIIVARDASRASFEEFWAGKTNQVVDLDRPDILYVDRGGRCSLIDDPETMFMLFKDGGVLDGPTLPLGAFAGQVLSFQRDSPESARDPLSWNIGSASGASPGRKAELNEPHATPYISEMVNLEDEDEESFEFVEIAIE